MPRLLVPALLLSLLACSNVPAPAEAPHPRGSSEMEEITGFHGRVTDTSGAAVAGATVYVYRNTRNALRGPADFAAETDTDGRYQLDLVAGSYHLVARWRPEGEIAGPPRPGDAWSIPPHNPLTLAEGENRRLDFVLQGISRPTLLPQNHLPAGKTAVSGRLAGPSGEPLAGAYALAHRSPDFRHRPDWISAPSGGEGRFVLYLPEGGEWCFVFRTRTRGQPHSGDLVGWGDAVAAPCRTLSSGHTLDLGEIQLTPAP